MKVLILGGSVFLSARVATDFLDRGHDVTCLSRSLVAGPPDGARAVSADRATGLRAYDDVRGDWDAVVDVATDPRFVRDALAALGEGARHWTYVSSCSVYADQNEPDADESREIVEPLAATEPSGAENYGASKSSCERQCATALDERVLIVRPGLIVGPGDPSDRGGYWLARFARGDDEVLVPEARGLWSQQIDVRDLSHWLVDCAETRTTGVMNAVGDPVALAEVIDRTRRVANFTGSVLHVADEWLVAQDVEPWAGPESLPLWIPFGIGFDGFCRRSHARASGHGLRLRELEATWADCLADERVRGLSRARRAGLSIEREAQLRALWHAR